MFQILPTDVEKLDDTQLRELVARVAQAELQACGYSPLFVTWGGSQTAPDGGLDVKATLPQALPCPLLPCKVTGYQVKKPDMRPREIIAEMRPHDRLRDILVQLAAEHGAYLIISSSGTTSERFLEERRRAMRAALHDCPQADQLHTDFIDRRRLTDWINTHSGVVLWVREQSGRSLRGWKPFGAWSNAKQGVMEPYLIDDHPRIRIGSARAQPISTRVAIERLRQKFNAPRQVVRLVGMSGVGKTRLVQALFDDTLEGPALAGAWAVYTDMAAEPDPSPLALATDLVAQRHRAILIIDNCGAALHADLSKLCEEPNSQLNLLTIEYDVSEDMQEHGEVVLMEAASDGLLDRLLQRRFAGMGQSNRMTIARASGGNARIALAIAETVDATDTLAGLRSEVLFKRLFMQRHEPDPALLRAAQVCSLVYSFDGETEDEGFAELPLLAMLARQSVDELHAHVQTLCKRDLLQRRGKWRALLPQALANNLARKALDEIRYSRLEQAFVQGPHSRMLQSFARRLSHLHDHSGARALCASWLKPGGILGDPLNFGEHEQKLFESIAPVSPPATLDALERIQRSAGAGAQDFIQRHVGTLLHLAYDAASFERCIDLLHATFLGARHRFQVDAAQNALVRLFSWQGAETRATSQQRYTYIYQWLMSDQPRCRVLGRMSLVQALSTRPLTAYQTPFGAHVREQRFIDPTDAESEAWFRQALTILWKIVVPEDRQGGEARRMLAQCLPHLWAWAGLREQLATMARQVAASGFWREGWVSMISAKHKCRHNPAAAHSAAVLVEQLSPATLAEHILAWVPPGAPDLITLQVGEDWGAFAQRVDSEVMKLGLQAVLESEALPAVLPRLLRTNGHGEAFGSGLAQAVSSVQTTWRTLVDAWREVPQDCRDPALLRGFLRKLAQRDRDLVEACLDQCATDQDLAPALPALQRSVGLDEYGFRRLRRALKDDLIPVDEFRCLISVSWDAKTMPDSAGTLLVDLAATRKDSAFETAVHVLMHWLVTVWHGRADALGFVLLCRDILRYVHFSTFSDDQSDAMARITEQAVTGLGGCDIATLVARQLREAVRSDIQAAFYNQEVLRVLLALQPEATLNALYVGSDEDRRYVLDLFTQAAPQGAVATEQLDPESMCRWCADDHVHRYQFMAMIVPVIHVDHQGTAQFTALAETLVRNAPDRAQVFHTLVTRMDPILWSGSRAAILEQRLSALDQVQDWFDDDFKALVRTEKQKMLAYAREVRKKEDVTAQERDERFE